MTVNSRSGANMRDTGIVEFAIEFAVVGDFSSLRGGVEGVGGCVARICVYAVVGPVAGYVTPKEAGGDFAGTG